MCFQLLTNHGVPFKPQQALSEQLLQLPTRLSTCFEGEPLGQFCFGPTPSPPTASKAQTKTWLQFCRGKTSHLITRAEKMGLLLIWHLVIFVWERFLPCNFSSDKSGGKLWQNHSPWRPAGVFVSHTHQHHTGLESEGVGVQLTDCPPPSSEMQCIIRGGQGAMLVLCDGQMEYGGWCGWGSLFCLLVFTRSGYALCCPFHICGFGSHVKLHFSQFGGYHIFHRFLAPD